MKAAILEISEISEWTIARTAPPIVRIVITATSKFMNNLPAGVDSNCANIPKFFVRASSIFRTFHFYTVLNVVYHILKTQV